MTLLREKYSRYKKAAVRQREHEQFIRELDSVASKETLDLLDDCRRLWDNWRKVRDKYKRIKNFLYGKQWEDYMFSPETGKPVKEKDYLLSQGKVPLINNMMNKAKDALVGAFLQNRSDSIVVARDRKEQSFSDMMSAALKYVLQLNNVDNIRDTLSLVDFLCSGIFCQKEWYTWNRELDRCDIKVSNININRIFANCDISDPCMDDLNIFGVLHDYTRSELVAEFAHSEEEAERILGFYTNSEHVKRGLGYYPFDGMRYDNSDFYFTSEKDKCRVIEVWTIESRKSLRVFDPFTGEYTQYKTDERYRIEEINAKRLEEFTANGVEAESVPLIRDENIEWCVEEYWYVRYLTPMGQVLFEKESPYKHKSIPYTLYVYPLVNGEVHPFMETFIDQQKLINRYISMMDFIRSASAKGVLVVPKNAVKGQDLTEITNQWRSPNGIIFIDDNNIQNMPQAISGNAVNASDFEMVKLQMNFFDEISGIHNALRGAEPSRQTPASLYIAQAQNSASNLAGVFSAFNYARQKRDFKIIKLIQQYYDKPIYMEVAGQDFSEEAKMFDPDKVKNCEYDNILSNVPSTPIYRSLIDGTLRDLLAQGLIDLQTYLENSSLPIADKLMQSIKRRQQEIQDGGAVQPLQNNEVKQAMAGKGDPQAMALVDGAV